MSILLYCIIEDGALSDVGAGVAALPVLHCTHAGLDALFSPNTSAESWTGASLKQSAREFHQVLRRAFAARAIVPFRFPTLMQDEAELAAHLRDHAPEYAAQLKRFEKWVQMDISITSAEPVSSAATQISGAEYLRGREKQADELQAMAKQVEELASETTQSWRERQGSNNLRAFALVHRDSVGTFRERLRRLSVPRNLDVRVSGPWPVTEFLELKQR